MRSLWADISRLINRQFTAFIAVGISIILLVVLFLAWPALPFISWSAEAWSAVAAFLTVVVALIAAYISRYQIQAADKAARLSIAPHCVLIVTTDNTDGAPHGLTLRNNGTGPAIIVEWSFSINGDILPEKNKKGLNVLITRYHLDRLVQGILLPPGASLGSNRDEKMFYVPSVFEDIPTFTNYPARKEMDELLKDVTVILKYTSGYRDEVREINSRDE